MEVTKFKLVDNIDSVFYKHGISQLSQRAALLGLSPGNSFFTEENITNVLLTLCEQTRHIYILIPDKPHVYNFLGLGYTLKEAKKRADRECRLINNRMNSAIDKVKQSQFSNFTVITWQNHIEENEKYTQTYKLLLDEY
ncbi:hypothetical protein C1141_19095, partial [Vibrio agarivorans]